MGRLFLVERERRAAIAAKLQEEKAARLPAGQLLFGTSGHPDHTKPPHILVTYDEHYIKCSNCGDGLPWAPIVTIKMWKRVMREFKKAHRDCRPSWRQKPRHGNSK